MKHWPAAIISILALLAMADSFYMTLAHYGLAGTSALEPSGACPLTGPGCAAVVTSSRAEIFGIPHAVLGTGYFLLILLAGLWRLRTGSWFAPSLMLAMLVAGVAWSAYLTYELLFVLRIPCAYCLAAHILNALILFVYASSTSAPTGVSAARPAAGLRGLLHRWAR